MSPGRIVCACVQCGVKHTHRGCMFLCIVCCDLCVCVIVGLCVCVIVIFCVCEVWVFDCVVVLCWISIDFVCEFASLCVAYWADKHDPCLACD